MVERVHKQIKGTFRAGGADPAWHSHLPGVLWGYVQRQEGFCNIISRTSSRSPSHPPRQSVAHSAPSTCQRAFAIHPASILHSGC
jgi:hypothetical protein